MKKLNDLCLKFAHAGREFQLLDIYHKEYYGKIASMNYINYALDVYNYYMKVIKADKLNSKRLSLFKTIELMEKDKYEK